MTRLSRVPREDLNEEQAALFDVLAGSEKPGQRPRYPRVGADNALEGPFNAFLQSPVIGAHLQKYCDAVRYESTLSDRAREFAILIVAARWDSAYERYAHEDIARAVGMTEDEIAAIAAGQTPETASAQEQAIIRVARTLATHSDLDDIQYADAVADLGERKLFEILNLVGVYSLVALSLRVFRVVPPTT